MSSGSLQWNSNQWKFAVALLTDEFKALKLTISIFRIQLFFLTSYGPNWFITTLSLRNVINVASKA